MIKQDIDLSKLATKGLDMLCSNKTLTYPMHKFHQVN